MKETLKYIFTPLAPWKEYAFQVKSVITLFLRNYNSTSAHKSLLSKLGLKRVIIINYSV